MESPARMKDEYIKTEVFDDFIELPDAAELHTTAVIKEENYEDDNVSEQSCPWNENPKKIMHEMSNTIEFDENLVLKTEIEFEEPKVQEQITKNSKNTPELPSKVTKSVRRKQKDVKQTKERRKTRQKPVNCKTKAFSCEFCSKGFTTQLGLHGHSRYHADKLPFECRVCMRRFSQNGQRKFHESSCILRRFECHICRFSSVDAHWNRFMVHFRRHTGEKPFKCKCCGKPFTSKRMLNHHMKYHPTEIPSKCSFCQRKFSSNNEAKEHESHCSLKRQMECYLCKSTFTYRSSLRRHMPQHTGLTAFNCVYCKKGYVRKEYLDLHLKTAHIKELQFKCDTCKMRFLQKIDVEKHKISCTKKQLFTCELCNYSTLSQIYAEDHKQKHNGADKFKCLHCDKVFLQRSKLVLHVKSHNKKSKFTCPFCHKPYERWLFMEKHKKICPNAPNTRHHSNFMI